MESGVCWARSAGEGALPSQDPRTSGPLRSGPCSLRTGGLGRPGPEVFPGLASRGLGSGWGRAPRPARAGGARAAAAASDHTRQEASGASAGRGEGAPRARKPPGPASAPRPAPPHASQAPAAPRPLLPGSPPPSFASLLFLCAFSPGRLDPPHRHPLTFGLLVQETAWLPCGKEPLSRPRRREVAPGRRAAQSRSQRTKETARLSASSPEKPTPKRPPATPAARALTKCLGVPRHPSSRPLRRLATPHQPVKGSRCGT